MSRKADYLDNVVVENFFILLKTDMCHIPQCEGADGLLEHIDEYIECYNTKLIEMKLKGLTLTEYRNQAFLVA